MKKIWSKILNDYPSLEVVELDYDMDNEEVLKYNPGKVLPVVIFLSEDGNEIERIIGEMSENTLREKISDYVK